MDSEISEHPTARKKGTEFESLAAHFLAEQGAQIVARNFHCRGGELDLVALIDGCLVFVEVRFRVSSAYGDPLETVNFAKQRKLKRAAQTFFRRNPHWEAWPCRFDVIAIAPELSPSAALPANSQPTLDRGRGLVGRHRSGENPTIHYQIEWVCDAFDVDAW